ncbi:hypothetical protein ACWIG5_09895 [Streptomyces lydicus]
MDSASLNAIDAVVGNDHAVISADDGNVVATVQEALCNGRSATFYISSIQAAAVKSWYWTPRRIKERGMEPVSREERYRIESDLGIRDIGTSYSNRIRCECGSVYGAFEFIQQGIREHGKDAVDAALDLTNAYILRVNPATDPVCASCQERILVGHEYDMAARYGCCRSE